MALKASLRSVSRKIAEAVESAAKNQHLSREDYFLAGNYADGSDHIYLFLWIAKPIDDLRLYTETFQGIRRAFPDFPSIAMQIGLVILDENEQKSHATWLESEEDITELLQAVTQSAG